MIEIFLTFLVTLPATPKTSVSATEIVNEVNRDLAKTTQTTAKNYAANGTSSLNSADLKTAGKVGSPKNQFQSTEEKPTKP